MQFVKPDININFIGKKNIAFAFSLLLILASIGSLIINNGPRYGIDFKGGTLIQIQFSTPPDIGDIKKGLGNLGIAQSSVQTFGDAADNEFLIRTDSSNITGDGFNDRLTKAIGDAVGQNPEIRRVEMVGPQVGKDLREKALLAMFFSLLFITVYISWRFELKLEVAAITAAALFGVVWFLKGLSTDMSMHWLIIGALLVSMVLFWFLELKFAMGAIVALIHDVTITVGVFSIFGKEFTLPIIAALLTIIGYSLNDTIIVFDRIRENQRKLHRDPLEHIINRSINETLSRTLLTSLTTLMVLITLFVLGGGIIHNFAFAMIIGVLIGTYSSIYVASPVLLAWQTRKGG